jgi:hypothetical protein
VLPPYIPAEKRFPSWPDARAVIDASILDEPIFSVNRYNDLVISWISPIEGIPADMSGVVEEMETWLREDRAQLFFDLAAFINKSINPGTLTDVRSLIRQSENEERHLRRPTIPDALRHCYGISPW